MNFFQQVTKPSKGTQETVEKKYVNWNKGLKGIVVSAETRAKISAANKGHVVSAETRAKLSAFNKGKKHTAEACAKMSASSKGKPKSAEHRAKLGAKKGRVVSAETRAKLGAASKGRQPSEETRAKISAAKKGKPKSEETRAKMSAAGRARNLKPIMTPNGLFPSKRAVAEASGKTIETIRTWIKKYPEQYYYVPKSNTQVLPL